MKFSWRSASEGCPVALTPAEIQDSSACTLCLNCAQTCCNDNVKLGFRGLAKDLYKGVLPAGEAFFFLVLLLIICLLLLF